MTETQAVSQKLKFVPLYSNQLKPEKSYEHKLHYACVSLAEFISLGGFTKLLELQQKTGFDFETNGLDASRDGFAVSGTCLIVSGDKRSHFDVNTEELYSTPPKTFKGEWETYTGFWIDFRGADEDAIVELIAYLRKADASSMLMAHNCGYEFKVANRVYDVQLWNLQDSMAYLVAGFFTRFGLKFNAKTLVNAHEWESEFSAWRNAREAAVPVLDEEGNHVKVGRKKQYTPGWSSAKAWGEGPNHLIGPYCAWDGVYTLSVAKELIRRDALLNELPEEVYPGATPISQSQEAYRRQILVSGLMDDHGVPTTKESCDEFFIWAVRAVAQGKLYIARFLGYEIEEKYLKFISEDVEVDETKAWPKTAEEHLEIWHYVNDLLYLEGVDDEKNYDLWNDMFLDKKDGRKMLRAVYDDADKRGGFKENPLSSWKHWAGMASEAVFGFNKGSIVALYRSSGLNYNEDKDIPDVYKAVIRLRWIRSCHKQANDVLNYTKREINDEGVVTGRVEKGLFTTAKAKLDFGWRACVMETRRWGSGFHIVSPRTKQQDVYDMGEGRMQLHFDLSGAEIQCAMAQAGEVDALEMFCRGQDVHTKNAAACFSTTEDKVTSHLRGIAKTVTFRLLFGSGIPGIAHTIGESAEKTKSIVDGFFVALPFLKKWIVASEQFAQDHHFRISIFGDRLQLPGNQIGTKHANIVIQHSSSNLLGIGLYNLARKVHGVLDAKVFGFIHDSSDWDVATKHLFRLIEEMQETIAFGQLKNYGVPARLDFEAGAKGASCVHMEKWSGTGSPENPWTFTVSGAYKEDFDLFTGRLSQAFHVETDVVKSKIEAALIHGLCTWGQNGPTRLNERDSEKVTAVVTVHSQDSTLHTKQDLSFISADLPVEFIDCNFPKAIT